MQETVEIIDKLKRNDDNAFQQLVEKFQDLVVRTAFAYLKNRDEAEDIAQEVFISIYQNINSFRGEANIKTWILRITINKSLNQLRKNKWNKSIYSLEDLVLNPFRSAAQVQDPYSQLRQKEIESAMTIALDKLPPQQRTAFILHKIDNLPQQEIANVLNVNVSAVESLIFRAKSNLQKYLYKFYKENKD